LLREVSKDRALSEAANAVAVTGGILTVLHRDGSSERLEFPCPPDALDMEISGLESCPLEGPVPMEVAGSSWIAHPLASTSAGLAEVNEA
jgi:hypothetical protein